MRSVSATWASMARAGWAQVNSELQALIGKVRVLQRFVGHLRHLQPMQLGRERAVAANPVDRAIARRDEEPGPRVGRQSVARPARHRDREGVLRGFLGELEVAEEADQCGQDTAPLVAEDLIQFGYHWPIGRISMPPP